MVLQIPQIETLELGPSAPGLPHLPYSPPSVSQRDETGRVNTVRTIFSKGTFLFAIFEYIEKMGNESDVGTGKLTGTRGSSKEEFIERISHYYCEINMLHPFASGNGIAQRVFFEQLAIHAGYLLGLWRDIDPGAVGRG